MINVKRGSTTSFDHTDTAFYKRVYIPTGTQFSNAVKDDCEMLLVFYTWNPNNAAPIEINSVYASSGATINASRVFTLTKTISNRQHRLTMWRVDNPGSISDTQLRFTTSNEGVALVTPYVVDNAYFNSSYYDSGDQMYSTDWSPTIVKRGGFVLGEVLPYGATTPVCNGFEFNLTHDGDYLDATIAMRRGITNLSHDVEFTTGSYYCKAGYVSYYPSNQPFPRFV